MNYQTWKDRRAALVSALREGNYRQPRAGWRLSSGTARPAGCVIASWGPSATKAAWAVGNRYRSARIGATLGIPS